MQYKSALCIFITVLFLTFSNVYAEPFKVGVILPLSGPVAQYGKVSVNGDKLFKSDFPNNNLEITYEDSRYEPSVSVTAYNKLVTEDKVDLIYVWGTGPAAAIAPISEHKKLPSILMTGDTNDAMGKRYSIDFSNQLQDYSDALLDQLRKRGKKKLAVVKTEIQFLETLVNMMKAKLTAEESLEILESYPPGQSTNFQSLLTKLKIKQTKEPYDALGIMLISGQLSSFYSKIKQQNIKIDTFTTNLLESAEERIQSGPSIAGAIYPVLDVQESFKSKYQKEFINTDQIGFAAGFYDFLSLLNDLFSEDYKNNKKLTPEEILSRIESVKERDGVSGKYYFTRDNPEGDPVGGKRFKFPIVIKEVTEGGGERVIK
jgi:ABC-type branched-subunit amino acid transport system substrate-binding protein